MKAMLNKKYLFWFVLFLVFSFLFIPALGIKFSWIDDAKNILVSSQLVESFKNLNFQGLKLIFFEGNGRFRVIYWLYQAFEYWLGGISPVAHFALHYLIILATSIFIFETVRTITKSKYVGLFSGLIYILSPINTENIFRLGPVEPLLAFFVTVSLFFLLRNKLFLSILFLFFASFSKETAFVVWLPIFLALLLKRILYKKRDKRFEKYCLWGVIFLIPIVATTLFRRTGYSTFYEFAFVDIAQRFLSYVDLILKGFAPFVGIFTLSYLIRLVLFFREKRAKRNGFEFIEQGIFLAIFLVFVLVQSPWKYVLERYLMPATASLVIFLGFELNELYKLIVKNKNLKKTIILIFIIYFFLASILNMVRIFIWGQKVAYETNSIHSMISYVAANSPENGKVAFNFITGESTIELIGGSRHLLELLYNRDDISTGYFNVNSIDPNTSFIIGRSGIRATFSERDIEKRIRFFSKIVLLSNKSFPVLTTPDNMIKQILKKTLRGLVFKEPLTLDGIYTEYLAEYRWYIYRMHSK
jgi:hypothetical protein